MIQVIVTLLDERYYEMVSEGQGIKSFQDRYDMFVK